MEAKNYRSALLDSFTEYLRGGVLEIGAGVGQMSEEIRKLSAVKRFVAVEPDERFLPHLRQALPADSILAGTAHDLPPGAWDAIVSINVLEHIEHGKTVLVAISSPRAVTCASSYRLAESAPDQGLRTLPGCSSKDLPREFNQPGFDIVTLRYYNLPGYFAWWFSFCLLKERGFDAKAVRFYDRAIFPLVYWAERNVCRPPIGQSLHAVVRARPKATEA